MVSSGSVCDRAARRFVAGAGVCLLLLSAVPAAAQETTTPAAAPEAAAAVQTVSTVPQQRDELPGSGIPATGEAIELSLEDALATALERNLGLLIERYERAQFRLRVDESLGIYDLNLTGQTYEQEETSPSTGELTGADVLVRKDNNTNVALDQLTPWGGVAGFELNLFRREDNSVFTNPNPFYLADVDVTATQPLLRNFGRVATERGIRIARINSDISRGTFEQQVTNVLQLVENSYWNLVEARQQVEVAEESLALARELHQMNNVRVEVGTLAPLELVQSEVGIATREEQIILARADVEAAEDQLRRLLHLEQGALWSLPIVPTTPPETERIEPDLEQAIAAAFEERPELASQQLRLDLLDLEARFARNQMLPRLDLEARYGYNGIGGDVRDENGRVVIPGGRNDAFDQVADRDFDGWRLALTFAYPLQNRAARARRAIANLDLEQGEGELEDLQEAIRVEVRSAVRTVRTAAQQIDSTRASRRLAEQNLDAERKRYENGLSTSFQVLEIQEDLTAARSREVAAIAAYRRALAEYWRATGRLLEAEGVELDDPLRVEDLDRFGAGITRID
jgi:outer membrane protein TolC